MKAIFIINPVAGKGLYQEKLAKKIRATYGTAITAPEIYWTNSEGDARSFVSQYPGEEKVRFYAVGGDGTLNEVVNGAMARGNCEIGLLPCGSGNDFVRIFGAQDQFLQVETQLAGNAYPVDVMKVNNNYAINICNMGIDAQTADDVHYFTKFMPGSLAYTTALLNRLIRKFGFSLKLVIDDKEEIKGTFMLVTLANGIAYGGGYYSAPQAKCDDCLMDICLVRPVSRWKIAQLLNAYKKGEHLNDPRFKDIIIYRQAATATLETVKPQKLCIDGEIITSQNNQFAILPRCLPFILPQGVVHPSQNRT